MFRRLSARDVGTLAGMAILGLFTSRTAASFDVPPAEFCPWEDEGGTQVVGNVAELSWDVEAASLAGHCGRGHRPPHHVLPSTYYRGYNSFYGGYGRFGGLPSYFPSNPYAPQYFRYYPSTYGGAWVPRPHGGCHPTYRVMW